MSDADLDAKFHGLADPILGRERAQQVLDLCWNVELLDSAALVAQAARQDAPTDAHAAMAANR
jgi:hypothetical protein